MIFSIGHFATLFHLSTVVAAASYDVGGGGGSSLSDYTTIDDVDVLQTSTHESRRHLQGTTDRMLYCK